MRTLFVASMAVVCAAIAACSDDDSSPASPATTPDAGTSAANPPPNDAGGGGDDGGAIDGGDPNDGFTAAEIAAMKKLSPLPAVPADPTNAYADNAAAALLGQKLFFDASYSGALAVGDDGTNGGLGAVGETGKVSCASCHGGPTMDDTRTKPNNVSLGTAYGTRNALSLVNSAFYEWTNWGGRFDSQWSLPLAVAENPATMKSTRLRIAHLLWDKYKTEYDAIFPVPLDAALDPSAADAARFPATGKPGDAAWDGMAAADQAIVNRIFANYGKAIAAYVRKLVSRNAAFDKYVAGQKTAIDAAAKSGLRVFLGKGKCVSCHSGPNFADDAFHAIGVGQPGADLGRYADVPPLLASPFNTSGAYSDSTSTGKLTGLVQTAAMTAQFRTKSLRGVASSGPYMHAGTLATLETVVDYYDKGGNAPDGGTKDALVVPLGLSATEKSDLLAFLKTLDGEPIPPALAGPPM